MIFLEKYQGRFWTSLILPTEIKCVSLVYIFLIKNIKDVYDVDSAILSPIYVFCALCGFHLFSAQ